MSLCERCQKYPASRRVMVEECNTWLAVIATRVWRVCEMCEKFILRGDYAFIQRS